MTTVTMDANAIIQYLDKPDNFARVESAYPDVDIDIALDLLHDPHHQLNQDVTQFLNDAIAHVSKKNKKAPQQKQKGATADFEKTKISTQKWLAIQSGRLAIAIIKHGTKASIEKIPAMAAGLTAASMFLGNLPDADPNHAVNQLCNNNDYNLCITPEIIANLKHDDQQVLTAMIKTANNEQEQNAISAIAMAAATTGVDFTFMMVFAQLESSLGKKLSTPGSTAEGIFQYVEGTWLESFREYAAHYDSGYTDMANGIYFDSETSRYKAATPEIEEQILALRVNDPELHSYVNAQDMRARDPMVLKTSLDDLHPPTQQEIITQSAQSYGVEIATRVALKFYNTLLDELGKETEADRDAKTQEDRRAAIVEMATAAYLDHFLGESGASRFMGAYNNSDLRNRPVGELVGGDKRAVSQWAIDANPGIFHNGDQTSVQVYNTIETRVDAALQLIETRVNLAQSMPDTIITVDDKNYTTTAITSSSSPRPKARPGPTQG